MFKNLFNCILNYIYVVYGLHSSTFNGYCCFFLYQDLSENFILMSC